MQNYTTNLKPSTSKGIQEFVSDCPICGKNDWCHILEARGDRPERIFCQREDSPVDQANHALVEPYTKRNGVGDLIPQFYFEKDSLGKPTGNKRPLWVWKSGVNVIKKFHASDWVAPAKKEKKGGTTAKKKKKKAENYEDYLPIPERDEQYRLLARNHAFKMHLSHKADLYRRGLTDEQINKYPFFSMWRKEVAPRGVSEYLPGFAESWDGDDVIVANNLDSKGAYFIPYFTYEGLVASGQCRTSLEGQKYAWLKGLHTAVTKEYQERPVSILHGDPRNPQPDQLLLMEGGLKGILVHEKWGFNTLSAATAYFYQSAKQVLENIEKLAPKHLIFCPDAGDLKNKHTRSKWTKQIQWFQENCPKQQSYILWWGQNSKEDDNDIDELTPEDIQNRQLMTLEQWIALYEEDIAPGEFNKLIRLFCGKCKEAEKDVRTKVFGKDYTPDAVTENTLNWEPGVNLPIKWNEEGKFIESNPKIIYKQQDLFSLILAIRAVAGKYIAVTTTTGGGKSEFVGNFNLDASPWDNVYYVSETHNAPTNDSLARNFTNIPPRHLGGAEIGSNKYKFSNLGKNVIPTIASNCHRTTEFHEYYRKGFSGEDQGQTPCGTCAHKAYCAIEAGEGYGAIFQKRQAFQSNYIRLDLRQLSERNIKKNSICFVDESEKELKPTVSTIVDFGEILKQIATVSAEFPELKEELAWLEKGIVKIFTIEDGDIVDRYGIEHTKIRSYFENIPDQKSLRRLLPLLTEALLPSFRTILKVPDSYKLELDETELFFTKRMKAYAFDHIDWAKYALYQDYREEVNTSLNEQQRIAVKSWWSFAGAKVRKTAMQRRDSVRLAKNYFQEEVSTENLAILNSLPGLAIVNIVEYFLSGEGALRIDGVKPADRKLRITSPNFRYIDLLKKFDMVVFLDATMNIGATKHLLGLVQKGDGHTKIGESQFWHIEQELPSYDNLKITSINIAGLGSSDISPAAEDRVRHAMNKIEFLHCNQKIGVIGKKGRGDKNYWFNHNRGSNEFFNDKVTVLILKFTPWLNVGVIEDEFRAVFGDGEGKDENEKRLNFYYKFGKYYEHKVAAEIQQAVGRLRHQWRTDEKLNIYLLATEVDLSFLNRRLGVEVEHIEGFDFTPMAGTQKEWRLAQAAGMFAAMFDESGRKRVPNQAAVAKRMGITQSALSQMLSTHVEKGWSGFRSKILGDLYDPNREAYNYEWDLEDLQGHYRTDHFVWQDEEMATLFFQLNADALERNHLIVPKEENLMAFYSIATLDPYTRGLMLGKLVLYANEIDQIDDQLKWELKDYHRQWKDWFPHKKSVLAEEAKHNSPPPEAKIPEKELAIA